MFHHHQCRNLAEAHLLRSRLLERDIESWVVNENASTLYFESLMPPRLLVADEDWEQAQEVMSEKIEPLDESFTPPPDEKGEEPETPFTPGLVEVVASLAMVSGALGLGLLLAAMILGLSDGSVRLSDRATPQWMRELGSVPFDFAVGGAILAVTAWVGIVIARRCRPRADGTLPLGARWIAFALVLLATPFLFILLGPIEIIQTILRAWNDTSF
jgi:Putative prokaryotic signal transducing protein